MMRHMIIYKWSIGLATAAIVCLLFDSGNPERKKILIYCKSGVRAEMIHTILKQEGFQSEYPDMIVDVKSNESFTIQDKG